MSHSATSTARPRSVDVLIVSHNTREILRECLRSIEAHKPPPEDIELGIRVFDNGSSDGTVQMLADQFPTVRVTVSGKNTGFGFANNALAADSSAEYLLLLNSDTVWTSDIVSPLLTELDRWPKSAVAGPRLIFPDGRPQASSQRLPSLIFEFSAAIKGTKLSVLPGLRRCEQVIERVMRDDLVGNVQPRQTGFLWATCWLLRRDFIERYGLFDVRFPLYDEDLEFCRRLRSAGYHAVYVPEVELVHLGGASSTPTSKLRLMRQARTNYYRLNHGPFAAFVYKCVVGALWRIRLTERSAVPRGG